MSFPLFFDPKNSFNLFGLKKDFNFLSNIFQKKKLPKVLMFSGYKGCGKSTLINHFLTSIFDSKNYDNENNLIKETSSFIHQFKNDIFPNIIYLKGSDFKSVKIEDVRNLKSKIFQSSILNKERFIILDDIELFNKNSLNGLLKIIEEPTDNNYFFLINNKSKPLLDTVKSRALELKIILSEEQRIQIIKSLIDYHKIKLVLNPTDMQTSPGNFIKFNYICDENKISITKDFIKNLSILLSLYKKNKDILYINLALFSCDQYLNNLKEKNNYKNGKIYEIKNFIFSNLNDYIMFNINQNALINAISMKLNND